MVGGQSITPMVKVRDLGVFIDRELTMEAHVSNTVRGCMYQLRQLRSVKRSLTLDSRRALATAFVASRIDYCKGVLYGVTKGEVQRLQMVLNAAARLVVGTGKFSHVTPIFRDVLHWLPVQHRISYKIPILARDCIHGIGLAYFDDVCAPVTATPGRTNLRSAMRGDLVIPQTRTKLGERSFRISAPTVWNSLPDSLKPFATSREHFRKELKTYLFRKAYAPASENYWRVNLLTYLLRACLQALTLFQIWERFKSSWLQVISFDAILLYIIDVQKCCTAITAMLLYNIAVQHWDTSIFFCLDPIWQDFYTGNFIQVILYGWFNTSDFIWVILYSLF